MISKLSIPFSPPDISDIEIHEVIDTLKSGWITTGKKTKLFEKQLADFCGVNKVVALNSATSAMELVLRFLGIGPGDEVIVPAYTYTASCSVICHVGAIPVIVDVKKDSLEMDYGSLKQHITKNTKAIIPVDVAGILCDYDELYKVLEQNKALYNPSNDIQTKFGRIIVMADSAHAFGAKRNNYPAGLHADFTCFSFHAVKNLTTAEGGAITWLPIKETDNEWIYNKFQILSLHGQTKDALSKNQIDSWEYDVVSPAYKCNMTDILASLGIAQLQRFPMILEKRHKIIMKYDSAFIPLGLKVLNHFGKSHISSGHLYIVRVPNITLEQRNEIILKLAENGISCNVHYKPLPLLTAYKNMGFDIQDYPNSYDYYSNEITLPLYSTLSGEQVDYIISVVSNIIKGYIQ